MFLTILFFYIYIYSNYLTDTDSSSKTPLLFVAAFNTAATVVKINVGRRRRKDTKQNPCLFTQVIRKGFIKRVHIFMPSSRKCQRVHI